MLFHILYATLRKQNQFGLDLQRGNVMFINLVYHKLTTVVFHISLTAIKSGSDYFGLKPIRGSSKTGSNTDIYSDTVIRSQITVCVPRLTLMKLNSQAPTYTNVM